MDDAKAAKSLSTQFCDRLLQCLFQPPEGKRGILLFFDLLASKA